MSKVITILIIILVAGFSIYYFFKGDNLSNDKAENDKKGRYITIVNKTNQIINEVHVTVGDGTEINKMTKENIDEKTKSFSIEIPKTYSKYDTFTVILVDRYDTEYQKTIKDVPPKGRTEIVINKDDVVEETNSLKNKIDRFFNGD